MSENVVFVDYQEAISIKVGRFLLSKGFNLASSIGIGIDELSQEDYLGVLSGYLKAKPIKFLGVVIWKPRRIFFGTIRFKENCRHDTNEQNWVFEVYGCEHVELLKQLAEDLASTFNVKILLQLKCEQSKREAFLSDYNL